MVAYTMEHNIINYSCTTIHGNVYNGTYYKQLLMYNYFAINLYNNNM